MKKVYPKNNDFLVFEDGTIFHISKNKFSTVADNGNGYLTISMRNRKGGRAYVHRVVVETFLENPNNYKYVDHIDRNKTNNRVSNLRWVSASENIRNTADQPRYSVERTTKRLPASTKDQIKCDYINGLKIMEISNKYNVPRQSVSRFVKHIREARENII
jgi:hypothetical protein